MGGLYTHTTRATGLVLTAAIYNADHVNHITNQTPQMTDDYSTDVSAMRLTTDPGGVGTESLATSMAGELERIRYVLKRITGGDEWYEDAPIPVAQGGTGATSAADARTNLGVPATAHTHVEDDITDLQTYELAANKGVANGYAALDGSSLVETDQLGTGTASASTVLRGNQTWAALPVVTVIAGACGFTASSGQHYASPAGTSPVDSAAVASYRFYCPVAGTLGNFRAASDSTAGTRTCAVLKNGSDTAMAISLANGVGSGTDADTVSVVAGDYLMMKYSNSTGDLSGNAMCWAFTYTVS